MTKDFVSTYVQKLGYTGPPLRSTYRHLACEYQIVREDKEVIMEYMKQEFMFVDHLVQEACRKHPATYHKTKYASMWNLS